MQSCHWGGTPASAYHHNSAAMMSAGAAMLHPAAGGQPGSCMAPQMNVPNFMGVPQHHPSMSGLAGVQPSSMPAVSSAMNHPQQSGHSPPPALSPQHDMSAHPAAAATAAAAAAVAAAAGWTGGPVHPSERRSSSIACLRLKAREHSVAAMGFGLFNAAYGK